MDVGSGQPAARMHRTGGGHRAMNRPVLGAPGGAVERAVAQAGRGDGGGTGHIFPALQWRRRCASAASRCAGWVRTAAWKPGWYRRRASPSTPSRCRACAARASNLAGVPAAVWRRCAVARVLRAQRPDAVVSFGGYAAGPGGIAARLARIPLLVHEQNRAAGMTNKVLAKVARQVLVGFPRPSRTKSTSATRCAGADRAGAAAGTTRFSPRRPVAPVGAGRQQGARCALNQAVPQAVAARASRWIVHQAGEKMLDAAREAMPMPASKRRSTPSLPTWRPRTWADVVVCRAGTNALTLAELCSWRGQRAGAVPRGRWTTTRPAMPNAGGARRRRAAAAAEQLAARAGCCRSFRRSRQAPGDGAGRAPPGSPRTPRSRG